MSSRPIKKQTARPSSDLDVPRSEARAIVFLLASLEASLEAHAGGDGDVNIVRGCISRIQKRFRLSDRDVRDAIVWNEANIDGILRLLDYARWEIRERLNDLQSFEELGRCVDRLAKPVSNVQ